MLEIDQIVDGKYRVERLIGEGGMGSVYAGIHLVIGRRVALKVLHVVAADSGAVKRFEREAQAAARIGNDHILDVIDFGALPDGSPYMVCEFLEGETLSSRVERQKRLSPSELVPITRQLLNGLSAAHAALVVHRDLKPDNIFLLRQKAGWADFVKIIDFGISKFQALGNDEAGMRMTATGAVMGTPYYLSPEQARGTRDADQRSDLYAVGVILYEAVTGKLPFQAQNFNDLIFKIVLQAPLPADQVATDVDPGFSRLVMKAMAKDPNDRFQSAAEMSTALEEWGRSAGLSQVGPTVSAPPRDALSSSDALPRTARPTPAGWGGTQPEQATTAVEPKRRFGPASILTVFGLLLTGGVAYGLRGALNKGVDSSSSTSGASASVPTHSATFTAASISPPTIEAPKPVDPALPAPAPPPATASPPAPASSAALPSRTAAARVPALAPKPARSVARPERTVAARPQATSPAPPPLQAPPPPEKPSPPKRVDVLGY